MTTRDAGPPLDTLTWRLWSAEEVCYRAEQLADTIAAECAAGRLSGPVCHSGAALAPLLAVWHRNRREEPQA